MKSLTEHIHLRTEKKIQIVRITGKVQEIVRRSGIKDGLVLLNPMHITAAVVVNDNESGLHSDYLRILEKLVPYRDDYRHNDTGEDNAAAHIWRQLMGHQVVLPLTDGELDFGTWEQVFYFEFDGQRDKRILVKVMGE